VGGAVRIGVAVRMGGAGAAAVGGGETSGGMLRGGSGNCDVRMGGLVSGSWKMRTMVSAERRERVRVLVERLGVVAGWERGGWRCRRR